MNTLACSAFDWLYPYLVIVGFASVSLLSLLVSFSILRDLLRK